MIKGLFLAAVTFIGFGCQHVVLQQSTLSLAGTVNDLISQQVLDNLALFQENDYAIPSHIRLKGGQSQVSDQLSPSGALEWQPGAAAKRNFNLGGQHQWFSNWAYVPVTDADDLRRLQLLYRWASGKLEYSTMKQAYEKTANAGKLPDPPAIGQDWVHVGNPPSKTRFIGHCGNTIIWVDDNHRRELSEFALMTLSASPSAKQAGQIMFLEQPLLNP